MTNETNNTGGPKAAEDTPDYTAVHRMLGQPRYTFKLYMIKLTTVEAAFTGLFTVVIWFIIDGFNLSSREIFGLVSWELMPFFFLVFFPLLFSIIHNKRPDLRIQEIVSGFFVPTRFKDFPDTTWKPPKLHNPKKTFKKV